MADQNTVIGAVAGAALGALLASKYVMKKSSNQKMALGAAIGAAAIGGAAYVAGKPGTPTVAKDDVGAMLPLIGEVDLVKSGAGAFAGAAIGSAFGNPVIGTAIGAGAATALSKWNAA